MRAIGVQRRGVRNMFLLEALFIALAGAAAGLAAAALVAGVASLIPFRNADLLSMFLVHSRLRFGVPAGQLTGNILAIVILSLAAAWLPARRAARLDPVVALRTRY